MDYLLYLQQLRDSAWPWLNEFIRFFSETLGGFLGIALIALVYWSINKRAGTYIMFNFTVASIVNDILKNIFCIYRPFVNDDRLQPFIKIGGYSFPSGHAMTAASVYGGIAVWQRKRVWVVILCAFMILFSSFARNYLGVHTLQDVAVGILVSFALILLVRPALKWIESHPKAEILVLAVGLAVAAAVYFLVPRGHMAAGILSGSLIGCFIERRFIRFEIIGSALYRAILYIVGVVIGASFYQFLCPWLFSSLGNGSATFFTNLGIFLIISVGWPFVINMANKVYKKAKHIA